MILPICFEANKIQFSFLHYPRIERKNRSVKATICPVCWTPFRARFNKHRLGEKQTFCSRTCAWRHRICSPIKTHGAVMDLFMTALKRHLDECEDCRENWKKIVKKEEVIACGIN